VYSADTDENRKEIVTTKKTTFNGMKLHDTTGIPLGHLLKTRKKEDQHF